MLFRLPIVKFFNRILNRITVTVVLVALQLAWLAWVFFALTTGTARVWVTGVLNGLSLLIILYLVRKDENSAYKVGWIALIGLLPLLGGALYLAFGNKRPSRRLRSKMQAVEQAHRADRAQQPGQTAGLCDENRGVSRYLTQYGCYPAWKNTTARYFSCGEAMYPALLADLEKAEKSIFLEFFIISQGKMWQGVEDILRRKAAQGVDVRLIYDDFGSLLGLPKDFVVRMERAHIRCIPVQPRGAAALAGDEPPRPPQDRGDRRQSSLHRRHQSGRRIYQRDHPLRLLEGRGPAHRGHCGVELYRNVSGFLERLPAL